MKPGEWEKLKAEWVHDSELRRLEDLGVKYEDQAERSLDHAAKPAAGPPHPWPSEIAKANRNRPGGGKDEGKGHENGHDAGRSM